MESFEKLLNKTYRFLSYRPRSEKEIRDYLNKKIKDKKLNLKSDEIINSIINKLKEQKFLNDEEFAKWWTEQRTQIKPRAIRIIKLELKQKGISREIIESTIHNSQFTIYNDLEMALLLSQKRMKRYEKLDKRKAYEKMGRFLASKGFDWDIIKQTLDEVLSS